MTDPLKGQRKAVNERKASILRWPADTECPVEPGDRFKLQSCEIEIETVSRKLVKGRPAEWHATFIRHEPDRTYLLRFTPPTRAPHASDSTLGMTETEKARIEGNYTSTVHSASPQEPESVGPEWKDKNAPERELRRQEERRQRIAAERAEREAAQAAARVKQSVLTLGRKGHDLTPLLADIFERLAVAEREAA